MSNEQTWVVLNDLQIPFHDDKVLNRLILPFVDELQPDGVILNGDVVDCYSISDFDKDPLTAATMDREIRLATRLMERFKRVGRRIWHGGNHEDRLRRVVWKNPVLLRSVDKASREKIVHLLDFPEMFGLAEYGFEWLPYGDFTMLGKLMVTHGSLVSKHSALSARAHFEKYGSSVLVGHTHRGGIYYKRDVHGVHAAYENFCLCKLTPEYVISPNWQQGFSVVHVGPNGFFNVTQIPILPGNQFYYGGTRVRG